MAGQLSGGVGFLMKKHKITVFDGAAKLKGKGAMALTGKDGKALPISRPRTSSWRPARGPARCPAWSPTAS